MKRQLKQLVLLFLCLFSTNSVFSGAEHLLPQPAYFLKTEAGINGFEIGYVRVESPCLKDEYEEWITSIGGKVSSNASQVLDVHIVSNIRMVPNRNEEAYHIAIDKYRIVVEAITPKGVYWALQTLKQLTLPKGKREQLQACEIIDWPAFRMRGFMHDVGRGFVSIEEIKKEISLLSQYKINVFHWHLTEDIGWRLQSKKYPQLNNKENYERLQGKFYTIEEAKELVEYCKKYNMILIPEVDMPGHSLAFRRAFGVDMQSNEGMVILKNLMDEICDEIFPDVEYLHIGTDEIQFTNKDFVPEMVAYLRAKGKKIISWEPGWRYQKGEIDMLQMWSSGGKPHEGIPVIDSRFHYLNHYDSFADIVGLYNSSIAEQPYGNADYAGSILALWNDRALSTERDVVLQNSFYPAMLALAERAWMGGGKYFTEKGTMIDPVGSEGYQFFQDFERRMLYHKATVLKDEPFAYVKQTNVHWRISDAFPNGGDVTKVFPPEEELSSAFVYEDKVYCSRIATGAGIYLRHIWGPIIPTFYENPQPNHTAYAWTYVWSPKRQTVGAWIEFQNYGRSEFDIPPKQGQWDWQGSKIWLNDNEILPPKWENIHTGRSPEIPLANENFSARDPLKVKLQQGWNKVFIKLPVREFTSNEVRLIKWMFTCVFVTKDGKDAVDGLIYSPDKKK